MKLLPFAHSIRRRTLSFGALLAAGSLSPAFFAAGSNMPWEAPLQSILDSIQGPVARIVAVIIIIATGLTLAFGDTSGGFQKADPDSFSGSPSPLPPRPSS